MATSMTAVTNFPRQAILAALALGTPKCMFADAAFTPVQDTLVFASSVTNEATGTSYSAGGIILTTPVVLVDTATNKVTFDADNITTAGLSVSCKYGVVYIYTGSLATSPVMGYADFNVGGGNTTVTEVDWDSAGILPWTVV